MKTIKPIALKKATLLTNEEMKNLFGGSAINSGSSVCNPEGKPCRLMVKLSGQTGYLPFSGKCTTIAKGAWKRCACVAGDYSSDPSHASNACS